MAAANLHLTLAFLGEVSDAKIQVLQTLAGRIRQPAFTLNLNDAGHWPRPGVVWLGCRQAPRGLLQLAEMLRSQAARNGCYQPLSRFIRASRCCAALPARCRCQPPRSAGRCGPNSFFCTNRAPKRAEPTITPSPIGRY
ncbi:2'-5'-RNA ligase [Dickeya solani]|nr:2'-5'-RNA ligase [Dickeya solani]